MLLIASLPPAARICYAVEAGFLSRIRFCCRGCPSNEGAGVLWTRIGAATSTSGIDVYITENKPEELNRLVEVLVQAPLSHPLGKGWQREVDPSIPEDKLAYYVVPYFYARKKLCTCKSVMQNIDQAETHFLRLSCQTAMSSPFHMRCRFIVLAMHDRLPLS